MSGIPQKLQSETPVKPRVEKAISIMPQALRAGALATSRAHLQKYPPVFNANTCSFTNLRMGTTLQAGLAFWYQFGLGMSLPSPRIIKRGLPKTQQPKPKHFGFFSCEQIPA